jgi:hypothetical protein
VRQRRLLLALAWLGVVAAVAGVSTVVVGGAKAQAGRTCAAPQGLPMGHRSAEEQLILNATDGESVVHHFGESRSQGVETVLLSAKGGELFRPDFDPVEGIQASGGDYYIRRDSEHKMYPNLGEQLRARLIPLNQRKVELCVVVEPKADGGVKPGHYKGTLLIVQGRNQEQLGSLPVELTFRASHWTAIEIVLVAVLLGVAVKVLSEAAVYQKEKQLRPLAAVKEYVSELRFPVILILAAIGGWLVFDQMYNGNPAWGENSSDIAKLFAVCFLAQMTSNQGLDVIRNAAGGA